MAFNREMKYYRDNIVDIENPIASRLTELHSILYTGTDSENVWINESTHRLMNWTNVVRSSYVRWAVALNGLHVAAKRYTDPRWIATHEFHVGGIVSKDGTEKVEPVLRLNGPDAAKAHMDTIPLLASYGLVDIYSLLEEAIITLFRIFWCHHPLAKLKGPDFKDQRKLYHERDTKEGQWIEYWEGNLDKWQRKKIYQSIDATLIGYYTESGMNGENQTELKRIENLGKNLKTLSVLRNCLVHGESEVTPELAKVSSECRIYRGVFTEGEQLRLSTPHLLSAEHFAQGLLGVINSSLMQRVRK